MEAGRAVFIGFWRTPPAELVLLLSLLLHAGLAFWRLWQRRSLRMPPIEVLQLATGVMIPLWLTGHVLGTAVLHRLADSRDSYAYVLALAWPGGLSNLLPLLCLVWLHGCIGLHRWLRLKPWYPRLHAPALALALLLPVLALLGAVSGARDYATRRPPIRLGRNARSRAALAIGRNARAAGQRSGAPDHRRLPMAGPPDTCRARRARGLSSGVATSASPIPAAGSSAFHAGSACWRRAEHGESRTRRSAADAAVARPAASDWARGPPRCRRPRPRSGASWLASRRPPMFGWPARSGRRPIWP